MLVGLYGRGYAPPWAMLALASTDAGASWQSRGIVMQGKPKQKKEKERIKKNKEAWMNQRDVPSAGNASSYDRGGGTPDGSMVAFNGS